MLATKCNTMFVVLENLPNSSFSLRLPGFCIPLYLSTHFTTDPLFCWFTLVLLRLSVGSERGSYYQLAECSVSISFGTCFKQKTTSSSLPAFLFFDLKLLKTKLRCGDVGKFNILYRHGTFCYMKFALASSHSLVRCLHH